MEHQDWKPVVLRKSVRPTPETVQVSTTATQKRNSSGTSVSRKLETDDDYKPPTVTQSIAKQIRESRVLLKMTQEKLAQVCNIPLSVVRDYERETGLYERKYIDPLCKTLKIVINRPK